MPLLPLPPWSVSSGTPLDGGPLPVSSTADVAGEWAPEIQAPLQAPLRDAIQDGQAALLLKYQRKSRYAAAQSDPGRATDEYLDEALEERGVYRQTGESNSAARTRMFAGQAVVSMPAIIAAANAILAQYTSVSCRYAEQSDGWFASSPGSSWSCHAFSRADAANAAHTPNYPDRLYPGAVPAGFGSLPLRRPPGLMPNIDQAGRWFLLRAPDISSLDNEIATVSNVGNSSFDAAAAAAAGRPGFFVGSGTNLADKNVTFVFSFAGQTADDVYTALISAVNALVGQGVRWSLIVDPNLVT